MHVTSYMIKINIAMITVTLTTIKHFMDVSVISELKNKYGVNSYIPLKV